MFQESSARGPRQALTSAPLFLRFLYGAEGGGPSADTTVAALRHLLSVPPESMGLASQAHFMRRQNKFEKKSQY
ncbi:hypothetical protein SKAU_G00070950 [Synaphobranchus kaupii]|uniref:Uncharacterized protein n=1 Tax=Synaphobranchus kaupii TaxID=118154 RepID=A0A9Q1JBQ1_SYNKA|nr:hypothetical protein SKAU_G00070950 [Synaphobranchus kaupii]